MKQVVARWSHGQGRTLGRRWNFLATCDRNREAGGVSHVANVRTKTRLPSVLARQRERAANRGERRGNRDPPLPAAKSSCSLPVTLPTTRGAIPTPFVWGNTNDLLPYPPLVLTQSAASPHQHGCSIPLAGLCLGIDCVHFSVLCARDLRSIQRPTTPYVCLVVHRFSTRLAHHVAVS